jgi:4-hydroxy-4-methyl-2-oxoglutarate aldolase
MQSSSSTASPDGVESKPDGVESRWDIELCEFAERNLYTAVVSDSLDQLGVRGQAMREYLRPIHSGSICAGWARTIACSDIYHIPPDPYDIEIAAIDSFLPGEVAVVGTQKSARNAPWGELLSTAARARGARGAIIDGLVRDVRKIEELGFTVFAAGIKPVDSMGRGIVTAYNVPVECGEVVVSPGDFVFADFDGVVVIPRDMVKDVMALATDKVQRENSSRRELLEGKLLRDVFNKYGVL